ncbi:NAD-dependent epimerase/dehydratase family protein [Bosea sp. NPDC055594]
MTSQRILVTGGSGFIGQALTGDLLAAGHEVTQLGRQASIAGSRHANADLSDPASLRSALAELRKQPRFDAIIHLAVSRHHREFPQRALDMFYVNTAAAAELLDFARETGVGRAVFGSTGTVYSSTVSAEDTEQPGSHESEFRRPSSYFAASKLFADSFCDLYRGFLPIATLRFYAPYGPHLEDRMLSDLVARVRSGRPLSLPASGSGLAFSATYVDDALAVIKAAIAEGWNETVNVAAPGYETIESAGHLIGDLVGKAPCFERGKAGLAPKIVPDTERLGELMPQHRFTDLRTGLAGMIAAQQHA